MNTNIIDEYPYPLNVFMGELSDYIIVYFDINYNIIDFNKEFSRIFNIKSSKVKHKKLNELMSQSSNVELDLSMIKNNAYLRKNIELEKSLVNNKIHNTYNSYVFKTNNNYCIIANRNSIDKTVIINQVARLNNELTNESRDLNRANDMLRKANNKIKNLLRTDEMTNLSNRRHFMEFYNKMFSKAKRYDTELSLIVCDLDKLKYINDNYGHVIGDKVLITLGKVLKEETREEDLSARIGGDEFIILLNNTSLKNGQKYAERIRKRVSEIKIKEISHDISISIGIACLRASDTKESLLKRSDQAMYKSKNNNGNSVCSLE